MSAESEIAELDKALAADGQDIVLRRVIGKTVASQQFIDVICRAFVRGYAPNELVGAITQQDSRVVLSPTQIDAARWPGGQAVSTAQFQIDPRVPDKNRGDLCYIDGRRCSVEAAKPITIDGVLVRIDMQIRG